MMSVAAGACPQEYTITRTWIATDACGNSSTCLQTIVLDDNTPPSVECPGDLTLECDANTNPDVTGIPSAIDNCDIDPVVTYNDAVAPGACPQESTISRTWTATDACGNSSTCIQTLVLDDSRGTNHYLSALQTLQSNVQTALIRTAQVSPAQPIIVTLRRSSHIVMQRFLADVRRNQSLPEHGLPQMPAETAVPVSK